MSIKTPDVLPFVIPLGDVPGLEALEDPDMSVNPEAAVIAQDHAGVAAALNLLTPRQEEIMRANTGLGATGEALSYAEIADSLGLSVETVGSTLTSARNRLRVVDNILTIINGEYIPSDYVPDNPLQAS